MNELHDVFKDLDPSKKGSDFSGWHGVTPPPSAASSKLDESFRKKPALDALQTQEKKVQYSCTYPVREPLSDRFCRRLDSGQLRVATLARLQLAAEFAGSSARAGSNGCRGCSQRYAVSVGFRVLDLALDESTTFDVLRREPRTHSWDIYRKLRREVFSGAEAEYLETREGHYAPLLALARCRNVKLIVLSVGGNDVYLSPPLQARLLSSLLPFSEWKRWKAATEFSARLLSIVRELFRCAPSALPLLLVPFHPHQDFPLVPLSGVLGWAVKELQNRFLAKLVTPLVRGVLLLALKYGLPVADLSWTFRRDKEEDYGTMSKDFSGLLGWSGAEPSDLSQHYIAELVCAVLEKMEGPSAPRGSRFYWAEVRRCPSAGGVEVEVHVCSRDLTLEFILGYTFASPERAEEGGVQRTDRGRVRVTF